MQINSKDTLLLVLMSFITSIPGQAQHEEEIADRYLERAISLYNQSVYDSLPFYYLQAREIYVRSGKQERAAECILGMGEYHRLKLEFHLSELYLDTAMQYIINNLGSETESWSDALYLQAKLASNQSRESEALDILEDCLALRLRLGSAAEKIARAYNVMGSVNYLLGDYLNAEKNFLQAYRTFSEMSSGPSVEKGWLLFNLSLTYGRVGEHEKWLEYTKMAIQNNTHLYGVDFADLAIGFSSLSSYYIESGDLDSAWYYLDKAEHSYIQNYGEDYYKLSEIYINRARIYSLEGNFYTALDYYKEAERIYEHNEHRRDFNSYIQLINVGYLYRHLGEYRLAHTYFEKLLDAEGKVHPARMTVFYQELAINSTSLGNFRMAEDYFKKVFAMRDEFFPADYYDRAVDLRSYGILLDSLGKYDESSRFFIRANEITIHHFGKYHPNMTLSLKETGDHYLRMNEPVLALGHFQQSLHSLFPNYDSAEFYVNPPAENISNPLLYLGILKQKARCLEMLAESVPDSSHVYLAGALDAYRISLLLTERLRNSYLNDRSKLYLSSNERETYENLVRIAYDLFRMNGMQEYKSEAFIAAEKAKYATLVSVLQRSDAISLAGVPDSIRQMEAGIRRELTVNRELLSEARGDTLVDSLKIFQYQARVFELSNEIEQFNDLLESRYPAYFNLLYNRSVLDPEELRKGLGQDERLIEYFIASGSLYVFDMSRDHYKLSKIPYNEELEADIRLVEKYLKTDYIMDSLTIDHNSFLETSNRLYSKLIPEGVQSSDLIIIPEGRLAYFPFDILIKEPVREFSGLFSQVPFLIREHSIRYAYSATLMNMGGGNTYARSRKLIAFAPGYGAQGASMASLDGVREVIVDRTLLESLPGSIHEVQEIGAMTGGIALTGPEASEFRFKELSRESHFIHLATHALLDDEDPLRSKLVFSEDPHTDEDGLLNVYEIYNLEMKACMVVLSACNTGSGVMKGGEGIMSLARAFYYAGIPNVVMTLWTVSDEQSYKLMLGFYRNLTRGMNTADALRQAKLDFMDQSPPQYQHPQYWAGFLSIGDVEIIFIRNLVRKLLAAILLMAVLTFIFRRVMYRRKPAG